MFNIGCHLSKSKGYYHMGKEALSINANTFQFFSRNPRGGNAKKMDENDVARYLELVKEHDFAKILAHAPYTMNACSKDPGLREFARNMMVDDLKNMEYLPGNMYNFHPGSHVGQGKEIGIEFISDMLNQVIVSEQNTMVLLETMAGKGTEIGRGFEEIKSILDNVELSEKMGVCMDTCHVHDAGYDIVNDLDGVLDEFDTVIGLDKLQAVHLNDTLNDLASHKDRHAGIGKGVIGLDAIVGIINHPLLSKLPFYLETPNGLEGYKEEIRLLRSAYKE